MIGHRLTTKMVSHVAEAVKLAGRRVNFRVRGHSAFYTVGIVPVTL